MRKVKLVAAVLAALLLAACGNSPEQQAQPPAGGGESQAEGGGSEMAGGQELAGTIAIDGSSTVAPLSEAVAEEFAAQAPNVRANVGTSGTGGGFELFCQGQTDISDASRPIEAEERQACQEGGVEYVELEVGVDALTMVTNPQTEFVSCLTTEEVARIFGPDNPAQTWQEVNPQFPPEPLEIFAPGTDSGTYDFMVEDVLDLEAARQDYNASEDDNIISQGIQGTPNSWGFFGFAYFSQNSESLKAIEYDGGSGCVAPSVQTAQDDSYQMTRPLFIYVKREALARPEVAAFVQFYLDNAEALTADVGYIPLPPEDMEQTRMRLQQALAGGSGNIETSEEEAAGSEAAESES